MSHITIFSDQQPNHAEFQSSAQADIRDQLHAVGVRFEQWDTDSDIQPGAETDTILAAYQTDINRLIEQEGYQTVDVVSLSSDHPQKNELRQKFLDEHTHNEDEVRFFVGGEGLFSLHIENKVYEVLCTRGDLISVPANTPHWFDMGPNPNFIAIRLFNNPEGWVAHYTGSDIASQFSRLENGA